MKKNKCRECGSEEVHILGKFEDGEELMMAIHKKDCLYMKKADKKKSFMLFRDNKEIVREWPSNKILRGNGRMGEIKKNPQKATH